MQNFPCTILRVGSPLYCSISFYRPKIIKQAAHINSSLNSLIPCLIPAFYLHFYKIPFLVMIYRINRHQFKALMFGV
uniref:Uncharacterized protein n=1 Tax=Lepeophtheirus salmonis TaxID=72036 RepID=A0A0K2U2W2_LEPSM